MKKEKFLCETNTPEVYSQIVSAAGLDVVFEYGQWYVKVCGAMFAVVDTNNGIAFEQA